MRIKKSFFIHILLIFIMLFSSFSVTALATENNNVTPSENQAEKTENENINENEKEKELNLHAKSCILIERSTSRVAYEKNADEKVYPASTTKLLTAILTLEHCNLDDTVTITYEMISKVPKSYTTAYLRPGEQATVEELLNVLLIPSANDAGFALAIHISGSVDEFAKLMNEKAKELGCTNSNFNNPCGIHDVNHYSTARDMSKIGISAMNYPQIMNIVCKTSYTLHENKYNARRFETTNTLINSQKSNYYEFANGMKTGYTQQAGACLIATAKKENMEFLAVILDAPEPTSSVVYRDEDAKTLFEFGFENYEEITKVDPPQVVDFFSSIYTYISNIMALKIILITLAALFVLVFIMKISRKNKKSNTSKKKKKSKK